MSMDWLSFGLGFAAGIVATPIVLLLWAFLGTVQTMNHVSRIAPPTAAPSCPSQDLE